LKHRIRFIGYNGYVVAHVQKRIPHIIFEVLLATKSQIRTDLVASSDFGASFHLLATYIAGIR